MTAIMTIPETLPTRKVLFPFPASLISSGASGFSSSTTGFGVSSLSSPSKIYDLLQKIQIMYLSYLELQQEYRQFSWSMVRKDNRFLENYYQNTLLRFCRRQVFDKQRGIDTFRSRQFLLSNLNQPKN